MLVCLVAMPSVSAWAMSVAQAAAVTSNGTISRFTIMFTFRNSFVG
jgi:hypothetical protein